MNAITTKYHGPGNKRGARIIANDGHTGSVSTPYDHSLDARGAHRKAAVALCKKKGWSNCDRLVSGDTKHGYVHVFLPESCKCAAGDLGRTRRRRRKRSR